MQVGVPSGVGSDCGRIEVLGGGSGLVVTAGHGRPTQFKPDDLRCYVIHVNRTELGLAKERLCDY